MYGDSVLPRDMSVTESDETTRAEHARCDGCPVDEIDYIDLSDLELDDNDDWQVSSSHARISAPRRRFIFFFFHFILLREESFFIRVHITYPLSTSLYLILYLHLSI